MSWFQNIQGQLSELANEVLSEATEEVADPESELQVANKKCAEAERLLLVEQTKSSSLENKVKELEEQLYSTHVEMDAIGTKYGTMIQSRDDDIKRLKIELEQSRSSSWEDDFDDSAQCIADLRKEVAHWKQLAKQSSDNKDTVASSELVSKLEELRRQKDEEMAALVEQNSHMLNEMRDTYEEKICALQAATSSSTSNVDLLDAVLLEKDELVEAKRKLEDMVNRKISEDPVVVDYVEDRQADSSRDVITSLEEKVRRAHEEAEQMQQKVETMAAERQQHAAEMESLRGELKTVEDLKVQNEELTLAYTELNEEYEQFKEQSGTVTTRNHDLSQRIDYLKANLIEYEERYEMCKKENAETVQQLDKLSGDFERLRAGFADSREKNSQCDASVSEEVERLRAALEESREERTQLRGDVDRFRAAVESIDTELDQLRDLNKRLSEENQRMGNTMASYDDQLKELLSRGEQELSDARGKVGSMQEEEARMMNKLVEDLKAQVAALQNKNSVLEDQVRLLNEMHELMQKGDAGEAARVALMEEKIRLLEVVKEELTSKLKQAEAVVDPALLAPSDPSDPVTSLTNQLREALAATSEKTEECEKLRAEVVDVGKEVTVRQGCVDDLIVQNNQLQVQYQQEAEAKQDIIKALAEKERAFLAMELELMHLKEEHETTLQQQGGEQDTHAAKVEEDGAGTSTADDTCIRNAVQTVESVVVHSTVVDAQAHEIKTLRSQIVSLESEISALMGQLATLTDTCKQQDAICSQMSSQLSSTVDSLSEKHAEHVKALTANFESSVSGLKAQNDALMAAVSSLENMNEHQSSAMEALKESAQAADTTVDRLSAELASCQEQLAANQERDNAERTDEMAGLQQSITALEQANEQLRQVATAKHAESVDYYTRLETACARISELEEAQKTVHTSASEAERLQQLLNAEQTLNEKRGRELQRLKDHLLLMEETSTREAVEAERRETDLRQQISQLQRTTHDATEGASESTQHYQQLVTSLTARAESAEQSAGEWRSRFNSEQQTRQQTADALASLQVIVRELSTDHEKESASASHRNMQLQTEIQAIMEKVNQLTVELERVGLDKMAAEERAEAARSGLEDRQRIIEDLEVQLEDARTSSASSKDSYRVDDATLRQLFLSYFTAAPDKKADIAVLLASILEYPQEDVEKIRLSVRPGAARTGAGPTTGGSSLTEQFIRFLENESESGRTAPHLPVSQQRTAMQHESPIAAPSASQAAALDDILH